MANNNGLHNRLQTITYTNVTYYLWQLRASLLIEYKPEVESVTSSRYNAINHNLLN